MTELSEGDVRQGQRQVHHRHGRQRAGSELSHPSESEKDVLKLNLIKRTFKRRRGHGQVSPNSRQSQEPLYDRGDLRRSYSTDIPSGSPACYDSESIKLAKRISQPQIRNKKRHPEKAARPNLLHQSSDSAIVPLKETLSDHVPVDNKSLSVTAAFPSPLKSPPQTDSRPGTVPSPSILFPDPPNSSRNAHIPQGTGHSKGNPLATGRTDHGSNLGAAEGEVRPDNPSVPSDSLPKAFGNGPASSNKSASASPQAESRYPGLIAPPETREISQEQLGTEAKSIYTGITVIESRCRLVDQEQIKAVKAGQPSELKQEHWQALIAIHRTLLHEHHDFFLATQHPSASPALKRLAEKYSMPARFWRHGIHSFLEVLRHRLPESLEYMLTFLYLAFQMLTLLYETVPTFENIWMECLGDLGRYRMAIEDNDRDRDVWTEAARYWYWRAADRCPQIGRLYHHLAILSRPNALQQLYFYCRSLVSVKPFDSTRESILALLDPAISKSLQAYGRVSPVDIPFVSVVSCLFRNSLGDFERFSHDFLGRLDDHISLSQIRWKQPGVYIAVVNIACVLNFGSKDSPLCQRINNITESGNPKESLQADSVSGDRSSLDQHSNSYENPSTLAWGVTMQTLRITLRRYEDRNVLPHVHVMLAFLGSLAATDYSEARTLLQSVPWDLLCIFLNTLSDAEGFSAQVDDQAFPRPEKGDWRPLPEDYMIREQIWTRKYFPTDWFGKITVDAEERTMELASTNKSRIERVLWLGRRIASYERWITFDRTLQKWLLSPELLQAKPASSSDNYGSPMIKTPPSSDGDVVMDDAPENEIDMVDAPDEPTQEPVSNLVRAQGVPGRPPEEPRCGSQHQRSPTSDDPADMADRMLRRNYTVLVLDQNILLNHRDLFQMLLEGEEWKVVVPSVVVTNLRVLTMDTKSAAAVSALDAVRTAIEKQQKIHVLTESGSDVTDKVLKESASVLGAGGQDNPGNVSIQITQRQHDLVREAEGNLSRTNAVAKPAVLVTEDKAVQTRARDQGVTPVAISMLKGLLATGRGRPRARSR